MSLIGCGSIHQGHERFSDDSRGRQEIFMCLAALLYEQFLSIREWSCQDIDQVLLHGDHFFLSSELLDKNASIRSKLPTAACWSREITEENLKQTCFMSKAKATSVPQLGNHSQYSSHVGGLNLIDESKSLPVEANNSTIKLHLPVEAKEKIVMIDESKSLPAEANNSTIELHLPFEAKEKIAMIDESKPLPVEANNSTIELHLAVEANEKLSEYIESKSLPVEVKENFAIVNSKYGSLVEANHSFPNSCFETNSESISPVESIHSTLQSNSFSTFESKENFSSTTLNFRKN